MERIIGGYQKTGGSKTPPSTESAEPQASPTGARLYHKLSLQTEADRQRRRLGQRFRVPGREVSVMLGALTLGGERHTVRIVRTRDDDTERLAIALNDGLTVFSWNVSDGAQSDGIPVTGNWRALVERVALDSPDQAQAHRSDSSSRRFPR